MKPCPLYSLTVFLAGILCQPALRGQAPITAFSASYIAASSAVNNYIAQPALSSGAFNGCSSTSYLYTFSNGVSNQYRLNNFIANGNTFFIAPASAATIKLRRVNNANASGNRSIVYMESTSASATACPLPATLNLAPPYIDVMETVLSAGMLNQGTDNIFTNAANGDGNNNNIERVDILFAGGLNTASPTEAGFAIFDRGADYQHDPFRIAAITSLDANGDPASFGAVKICIAGNGSNNNGSWGHPAVTANGNKQFAAYVMRKDAADPYLRVSSDVNQEIGGVFFSFADLGIAGGQPLYGYALLGPDGTANPSSAQLLNLNNAAIYPTQTTEAQGGGLDLVAVNTVFATGSYIVLPVQIGSFTGSMQNGATQLQWSLDNAAGNEQVALERSADGVVFSSIYTDPLNDAGPLTTATYTDHPAGGATTWYYRLVLTVSSGQVSYSKALALQGDQPGSGAAWEVYPTAAARAQSLTLHGLTDGSYMATFYDFAGNAWKENILIQDKQARIDQPPGGLAPGMYWLRLTHSDNSSCGGQKILVR